MTLNSRTIRVIPKIAAVRMATERNAVHHVPLLPMGGLPEYADAQSSSQLGSKRPANVTDDEALELKRLKRLEKNRESARECRRRKKEYKEKLEQQLASLEEENQDLRLRLKFGSEAGDAERTENLQVKAKLDDMVSNGVAEGEILETMDLLKERFADYGRAHASASKFHVAQLSRLLLPTLTTRVCMHAILQTIANGQLGRTAGVFAVIGQGGDAVGSSGQGLERGRASAVAQEGVPNRELDFLPSTSSAHSTSSLAPGRGAVREGCVREAGVKGEMSPGTKMALPNDIERRRGQGSAEVVAGANRLVNTLREVLEGPRRNVSQSRRRFTGDLGPTAEGDGSVKGTPRLPTLPAQAPSSAPGDSPPEIMQNEPGAWVDMWTPLVKTLEATEEQQGLMQAEAGAISELAQDLESTMEILKRLKLLLADRNQTLGEEMAEIQRILTPTQSAKFVLWVYKNEACVHMLNQFWDKLHEDVSPS